MASTPELQHTVGKSAGFSGTALHTGEKVTLRLHPAPVDHGIKFRRKDLQDEPTIDAKIENLKMVERATTIGEGSVRVHTVEHVLAALWAMGVDNAIVEMDANEPPIGDGSAQAYVDLVKKAGVTAQEEPRKFFDVRETMHVEKFSRLLFYCRTVNFAFHAHRPDQTINSRSFCHWNLRRRFSSARSLLHAHLFTTRMLSRSWIRI